MGNWDELWGDWDVVGNSSGYGAPVFTEDARRAVHCFVKVGDELRHARYHGGQWDDFASVDGGRFKSDPVVLGGRHINVVEVYGVGLEGQLVRNVWRTSGSSWRGWEDLGKPAAGILGNPAVAQLFGSWRFVVVKGGDNRLYLRYTEDDPIGWRPWEQGDKLKAGQFTGDPSIFTIDDEVVVVGRSLENEMASISLRIT